MVILNEPLFYVIIDITLHQCTGRRALRHLITRFVRPTRTYTRVDYRMVILSAATLKDRLKESGWTRLDFAARNWRAPVSVLSRKQREFHDLIYRGTFTMGKIMSAYFYPQLILLYTLLFSFSFQQTWYAYFTLLNYWITENKTKRSIKWIINS